MGLTAQTQSGLYFARKRRLARVVISKLTAWQAGLAVTAGQYVQNIDTAYKATTSGTTGATAPTHARGIVSDGTVSWLRVDSAAMNRFVFNAPPTP